ncbi:hypothetical protein D3C73_760490 [compost metagenome]
MLYIKPQAFAVEAVFCKKAFLVRVISRKIILCICVGSAYGEAMVVAIAGIIDMIVPIRFNQLAIGIILREEKRTSHLIVGTVS